MSIDVDGLPTIEAFEQAVLAEHEKRTADERDASIRQRTEYGELARLPEDDRREVDKGLEELIQLIDRIQQRPLPWTETATKQILGDFERTWRQLHEATKNVVESTAELAGWLDANAISPDTRATAGTREDYTTSSPTRSIPAPQSGARRPRESRAPTRCGWRTPGLPWCPESCLTQCSRPCMSGHPRCRGLPALAASSS